VTESPTPINIVFVLFPEITQLDFTGPAQFLTRLPGARLYAAAETLDPIQTDSGFSILPNTLFESCPQADVLCVPGGFGVESALARTPIVDFVRTQGREASWVTSVCTGAFVLGAAGLLNGKRATTHWAYTHLLPQVGATHHHARVVEDGNVVTAGGVTSGIDFALTLIARVATPAIAQRVQLALEYDPAPPYRSGHPSTAAPALVTQLNASRYACAAARMEQALKANVLLAPEES
jgi:cyclohexyl-isocyanide hydratase